MQLPPHTAGDSTHNSCKDLPADGASGDNAGTYFKWWTSLVSEGAPARQDTPLSVSGYARLSMGIQKSALPLDDHHHHHQHYYHDPQRNPDRLHMIQIHMSWDSAGTQLGLSWDSAGVDSGWHSARTQLELSWDSSWTRLGLSWDGSWTQLALRSMWGR
jgi:hypothetical protein